MQTRADYLRPTITFGKRTMEHLAMDYMLVGIFASERCASAAARKLRKLEAQGSVLVYSLAVIVQTCTGISTAAPQGPRHSQDPVLGMGLRSLLGLLEISSIADETSTACRAGEMAVAGVEASFIDDVSCSLVPGKAAIVCEVEEAEATSMDVLLESHGGRVFRCLRRARMETQVAKEWNALQSEIHSLEVELLQAPEIFKASLQARIDLAKGRLQLVRDRMNRHAQLIRREAEAKLVSLQERTAKAEGAIRIRIENLTEEVRVDYAKRATRFNQAWQIAREFVGRIDDSVVSEAINTPEARIG